ncbi:glycosyltransferase family 2 protein [Candidatus Woesearchaeota archaeon]|nr:glycosyltransferase family 2 protein [Candidatus Woesearchaeota archaeon]
MNPRVNIIICTFNNKDIIGKVLKSVKLQSYRNYDCTVIDDNSSDGLLEYARSEYPWVKVVRKKSNTGPSASRNLGINITRGKYIATLDSDVELSRDWLAKIVRFMEADSKIGIAASKLLYSRDRKKINSAGGTMTKSGIGKDIGRGKNSQSFAKRSEVFYACSAAMMVRRDLIKKIGGFDDSYFYGHEDTDLGWRAHIAGYRVVYNPNAIAYHDVSRTISKEPEMVAFNGVKNRIRSILKNYEMWDALKYVALYKILLLGDIAIHGNRIPKIKAVFWNIRHVTDTLRERRKVQKTRKVADEKLFGLMDKRFY